MPAEPLRPWRRRPKTLITAFAALAVALLVLGALQGWIPSPLPFVPQKSASVEGGGDPRYEDRWLIAFATNAPNATARCNRTDFRGCDLYTVEYDEKRGRVDHLRRITTTPGFGEWLPTLSDNACWLAYTSSAFLGTGQARHFVHVVHLPTGRDQQVLADARMPDFSRDAGHMAFAGGGGSRPTHLFLASLTTDCANGHFEVAEDVQLTQPFWFNGRATHPDFLPDNFHVVFQYGDGAESRIGIVHVDGHGFTSLTPADGSHLPFALGQGWNVGFSNAHAPGFNHATLGTEGTGWSAPQPLMAGLLPNQFRSQDERYGQCEAVETVHATWLGPNGDQVIFAAECLKGGDVLFARLFLARLTPGAAPKLIDFSSPIERLLGKSDREFSTPDVAGLRVAET